MPRDDVNSVELACEEQRQGQPRPIKQSEPVESSPISTKYCRASLIALSLASEPEERKMACESCPGRSPTRIFASFSAACRVQKDQQER
jgi:hypothetical protein